MHNNHPVYFKIFDKYIWALSRVFLILNKEAGLIINSFAPEIKNPSIMSLVSFALWPTIYKSINDYSFIF